MSKKRSAGVRVYVLYILTTVWVNYIRHWEVTARVKGFSFGFLDLFDLFDLFLTWREHVWVSWSVRRGRAST